MHIIANRPRYEPAWVIAAVFGGLWRNNENLYVASWEGPPRELHWFEFRDGKPPAFKTADAYLERIDGRLTIGFVNGRHRTRWLMNHWANIPVGLEQSCFEEALRIGLAIRRVEPHEQLGA